MYVPPEYDRSSRASSCVVGVQYKALSLLDRSAYTVAAFDWQARGALDSRPELPGLVLFRRSGKSMAHTGLYIGGGRVVHAKGHAYGVVETALSGGGWTHWAAPKGLYTADQINAAESRHERR